MNKEELNIKIQACKDTIGAYECEIMHLNEVLTHAVEEDDKEIFFYTEIGKIHLGQQGRDFERSFLWSEPNSVGIECLQAILNILKLRKKGKEEALWNYEHTTPDD